MSMHLICYFKYSFLISHFFSTVPLLEFPAVICSVPHFRSSGISRLGLTITLGCRCGLHPNLQLWWLWQLCLPLCTTPWLQDATRHLLLLSTPHGTKYAICLCSVLHTVLSTPASAAQYYCTPTSWTQHLFNIFYFGARVRQHYSHSSAQFTFRTFNNTW
jgi:hypothetical protein